MVRYARNLITLREHRESVVDPFDVTVSVGIVVEQVAPSGYPAACSVGAFDQFLIFVCWGGLRMV
ncbi:hypothetical protein [Candidatus Frankia alpina]|uniref:Uncharacterized protein n=1 Tax=Candidatus Frankia alpina TaxID=2699483 RepID=A0A4S5EKZ4_9ACTN|nr:hypothetical protein [Candidatus Frankia alpina]THJ72622.1 hypothetical protein E7Y31_14390 [Candidatus Frankia alpina]